MKTLEEILNHTEVYEGGEIRHAYTTPEGEVESVALNNLLAARTRLAADLQGNRLSAYFVLPNSLWTICLQELWHYGLSEGMMTIDSLGAAKDIISGCRFYHSPDVDNVLVYTPHNDIVWRLQITNTHKLISREQAFSLLGPNKGFDMIFPYHFALGFAPPQLLLSWADEGYVSAKRTLEQLATLPTAEKLLQLASWERAGYTDSRELMVIHGLASPEELLQLEAGDGEETHTDRRALPQPRDETYGGTTVDGSFTVIHDN